jgi:hypothetical protein
LFTHPLALPGSRFPRNFGHILSVQAFTYMFFGFAPFPPV